MSISPKKRITKKIDNSHVVWFEESNSWIQFEEPAWFIYNKLISGTQTGTIWQQFSKRYGLNFDESIAFVKDIIKGIKKVSSVTFHPQKFFAANQYKSPPLFFSCHTYRINKKRFEISYESRLLEYMIHPSFAHLEIKNKTKPHFRLETFSSDSSSILKTANRAWAEDDGNLLKRRLFIEITGLLYGKSDKDWLSFIHGSAVCNEKESIILSTACGSGKSTLAALLCSQGLKFVSDDYVPIDARFGKAWPFPAALSVKDGAYPVLLPFYDQLKSTEIYHFKGTNKTIRYLPLSDEGNFYKPLPVKNLVFIQYDPSKTISFRKIPILEAFRRFNEEAWVSSLPQNARKFISWFPKIKCYELEYSDDERAIQEIVGLFRIQ